MCLKMTGKKPVANTTGKFREPVEISDCYAALELLFLGRVGRESELLSCNETTSARLLEIASRDL